jgi:hypothetical protein
MRVLTKPSTADCNVDIYTLYLLSDPCYTSCTRLSSILQSVSHDSINRFLERERYEPKDLYDEQREKIELVGGTLSVDDSVLDKPYSDPAKADFIDHFWSGRHKQVVKGINLISLFYTDIHGVSVPVNYRIYDKKLGKTKNDYFREMLLEVLAWGLRPQWITGDSWYASVENLKFVRKQQINFMFGVENNRLISIERGKYIQIQTLEDWPHDGKTVYLKDYGMVRVFRQLYKHVYRYYILGVARLDDLDGICYLDFERVHTTHWSIERFHRAVKQVCNIERFQVRRENQIKNHIFCALKAFTSLEFLRFHKIIPNWYSVQKSLFLETIRSFMIKGPEKYWAVNA